MLADLRRLEPLVAHFYLDFVLRPGSAVFIADFVRDVVDGGMEAATWGFQDVLAFVVERTRGRALVMSAAEVEARLAEIAGERWTTAEPRQIAEAIGVAWKDVSADGAAALSGLVREARTHVERRTYVPGFVGPNEWFLA